MMQLKSYLSDRVDNELRKAAMERFGYGRGAISHAVEEALIQWLKREAGIKDALQRITDHGRKDDNIIAIVLFGSYARKEPEFNDVDVGIIVKERGGMDILKYWHLLDGGPDGLIQISIINDFPEWTQMHIMDEGKPLQINDRSALYEYASKLILNAADNMHIASLMRS